MTDEQDIRPGFPQTSSVAAQESQSQNTLDLNEKSEPVCADREQIARFVAAVFANAPPGSFVALRSFYDDRRDSPPFKSAYVLSDDAEKVTDRVYEMAVEAANCSRPVVVCPPLAAFAKKSAKTEDLAAGLALSVECDAAPTQAREKLSAILGFPTLVVASGGHWPNPETGAFEDKLHMHWLLDEPAVTQESLARLRRLRELACDLVGADGTSKAVVHPMRWPGSVHRKKEPRLCRIIEQHDSRIHLDDALAELEGLQLLREGIEANEAASPKAGIDFNDAKPQGGGNGGVLSDELLMGCAERIPNENLEWDKWNCKGMAYYKASDGSDGGFAAFDHWSQKSKKYDSATTAGRWRHYKTSPPKRIGAGTLVFEARKADPTFMRKRSRKPCSPEVPAVDLSEFPDFTHDHMALEMGEQWQNDARYVALWGKWLFWDGQRWVIDEKMRHITLCRKFLRSKGQELIAWAEQKKIELVAAAKAEAGEGGDDITEIDLLSDGKGARGRYRIEDVEKKGDRLIAWAKGIAKSFRSLPFISAVVSLARSNDELVGTVDQWDQDETLLGTPDGTVELRTGHLRPAQRDDYITKQTAVGPAPPGTPAPIWDAFLQRIFRHAPDMVPFMQRVIGYALTGSTKENVLLFAWGMGGNGKGVFMNTISAIMGDYAAIAPPDLLLVSQGDRHPTDLAMLRGARYVTASELAPGRAWDEPKLKSLTGGDPITARFMRQDFFTYEPQFTLMVAGNHKPPFKGVDEAIRRRVLLLPFLQNIPAEERDKDLPAKLEEEWPAILRWAIDGSLQWQEIGLAPPDCVREASEDYLAAEDVLAQWLSERCVIHPAAGFTGSTKLYNSWRVWAEDNGIIPGSAKSFSQKLTERGFQWKQRNTGNGFEGIRLNDVHAEAFSSAGSRQNHTETVF